MVALLIEWVVEDRAQDGLAKNNVSDAVVTDTAQNMGEMNKEVGRRYIVCSTVVDKLMEVSCGNTVVAAGSCIVAVVIVVSRSWNCKEEMLRLSFDSLRQGRSIFLWNRHLFSPLKKAERLYTLQMNRKMTRTMNKINGTPTYAQNIVWSTEAGTYSIVVVLARFALLVDGIIEYEDAITSVSALTVSGCAKSVYVFITALCACDKKEPSPCRSALICLEIVRCKNLFRRWRSSLHLLPRHCVKVRANSRVDFIAESHNIKYRPVMELFRIRYRNTVTVTDINDFGGTKK